MTPPFSPSPTHCDLTHHPSECGIFIPPLPGDLHLQWRRWEGSGRRCPWWGCFQASGVPKTPTPPSSRLLPFVLPSSYLLATQSGQSPVATAERRKCPHLPLLPPGSPPPLLSHRRCRASGDAAVAPLLRPPGRSRARDYTRQHRSQHGRPRSGQARHGGGRSGGGHAPSRRRRRRRPRPSPLLCPPRRGLGWPPSPSCSYQR